MPFRAFETKPIKRKISIKRLIGGLFHEKPAYKKIIKGIF